MEFNTLFTGKNFIELERVDSSNNYAANLLKQTNVPDGTVILAHFQENGRGQMGNSWQSVAGQNIMTSIVYHFGNVDVSNSFLLSKAVALAIFETVNDIVKQDVSIKWPNDILVGDQKIAGMLIENKWQGKQCSSIVGIGLNVNQRFFGELHATSLSNCSGLSFEVNSILKKLVSKIENYVLKLKRGDYRDLTKKYLSHLLFLGIKKQFITASNEIFSGKIIDVKNTGHLVIELDDKTQRQFMFKQISVLDD